VPKKFVRGIGLHEAPVSLMKIGTWVEEKPQLMACPERCCHVSLVLLGLLTGQALCLPSGQGI